MKPLRFCMVTTFYPPYNFGGDGIAVQHLSRALVRRGHEVTVIHDRDAYLALAPDGPPEHTDAGDGVTVIGLQSRMRMLSLLLTQQTGRPLRHGPEIRAELQRGYDVVNFHNISLVGGPGVLSYPTEQTVRLYTAHEHWLVCPMHTLWRHNREPCTGRECFRCSLHYHRPPQTWRGSQFYERQLNEIDAFIALSEFSRAKHREFGFRHDMEVIPLFIPSAVVDKEAAVRPQERPYFLYVGRLERIKGLDDVIETFRGYEDADLLIAGEGNDGDRLRKLAEGAANIRFVGRLDAAAMRRHVRNAVALIAPSRGFETFGLVIIEAFREGVPVIARRIGPLPELVEKARGGDAFVTASELRSAMWRMQHDDDYREAASIRGKEAFHANWTEDVVIPQYMSLIERLAGKRGALSEGVARELAPA